MSAAALESGAVEEQVWFGDWMPTATVFSLAQTLYDGTETNAGPLHDALIDAGLAEDSEIVRHFGPCSRCGGTGECGPSWDGEDSAYLCRCRGKPLVHPKGCWALDLLLGKE